VVEVVAHKSAIMSHNFGLCVDSAIEISSLGKLTILSEKKARATKRTRSREMCVARHTQEVSTDAISPTRAALRCLSVVSDQCAKFRAFSQRHDGTRGLNCTDAFGKSHLVLM